MEKMQNQKRGFDQTFDEDEDDKCGGHDDDQKIQNQRNDKTFPSPPSGLPSPLSSTFTTWPE